MNMPGFTAAVSLYKPSAQTARPVLESSTQLISPIHPAMISSGGVNCSNCLGGECAELHCFEQWAQGGGGGGGPYAGGGGGGGGGAGGGLGGRGGTLRNCVDYGGQRRRHGSTRTTTQVLPPGGPENTYVTRERCSNGRWNLI